MPQVPPPEALPSERDLRARMLAELPEAMRKYWEQDRPIEMRPVDVSRYFARERRSPQQYVWMRATGRLPDDAPLHQCVLAYASDFSLLDTALIAHGKLMFDKDIQLASLDHALWFTARSAPTSGCSMARTVRPATARGASAGAASSPGKARWSRQSPRRV
jgi:acyl-CoA thioesterase-2